MATVELLERMVPKGALPPGPTPDPVPEAEPGSPSEATDETSFKLRSNWVDWDRLIKGGGPKTDVGLVVPESVGAGLSNGNPVHRILAKELVFANSWEIRLAYEQIGIIVRQVRKRIEASPVPPTPQQQVRFVYDTIRSLSIDLRPADSIFLFEGIRDRILDCDTSSFVVLAVGYELGWPVSLVTAPRHVFVRWGSENDPLTFNMDYGLILTDEYYIENFSLSDQAVEGGIHLRSLDEDGFESLLLSLRGAARVFSGDYSGARLDLDKALQLDRRNLLGVYSQAAFRIVKGNHLSSIHWLSRVLEMEPNSPEVLFQRGSLWLEMNNPEKAYDDFLQMTELFSRFQGHFPIETKRIRWLLQEACLRMAEIDERSSYDNALFYADAAVLFAQDRIKAGELPPLEGEDLMRRLYARRAQIHRKRGDIAETAADAVRSISSDLYGGLPF